MLDPPRRAIEHALTAPVLGPAISALRYAYPALVFSYYIISTAIAVCTLQTKSTRDYSLRRANIPFILLFGILTYAVQLSSLFIQSIVLKSLVFRQDDVVGLLSCVLVFGLEIVGLLDSRNPVSYPYIGSYLIALVFEPTIEILSIFNRPNDAPTYTQVLDISAVAIRCASYLLVLGLFLSLPYNGSGARVADAEQQPLLRKDTPTPHNPEADEEGGIASYGSVAGNFKDIPQSNDEPPESPWERRERRANKQMEKRLKEKGNWLAYAKSFLVWI